MNIFAIDTFFYVFCTYIRMHFRILGYHFENVVCASHDETREKMRKCIRRHQELIELVNQLETLYSKSTLFNILSSSLLICLSGFNITIVAETTAILAFIPFLVVSLTQISLTCFYGDMLMASSTKMRDAVYNCRWYDAPPDIKKSVFLVQFRASKPCKVTAANFAVLNLTAFTTAIQNVTFAITFLVFLTASLLQIYLLCFFGDLLMKSSMEVKDAVYNCKWYYLNAKMRKILIIVHSRAQKPCKLTAFGFSDVNLRAFMSILSSSWSYFALLKTIYNPTKN
ncbi:odorant receptor 67c-like [Nymphalis io]|uniref:odorant receptor 67c-like n=1 Tax=Inachis io TaxID=171585 RepID=UPI002167715C|nr:odorant receptor 67c-like [Nymphalis io]